MSHPTPPDSTPQGSPMGNAPGSPVDTSAGSGVGAPALAAPDAPQPSTARRTKRPRNTVGLIAAIAAVVGFIFACIPGALIMGWILLPIAFILSLVSFFMKGKGKGLGIAALIIAVVGTIVGFVVFFSVMATSLDDAFSGGETTISAPADELNADEVAAADEADADTASDAKPAAADEGTRENPLAIGSTITQGDWAVTVDSVNLNAGDAIAAANQFNDPAPEGSVYVLVTMTATYNGTDANGTMPSTLMSFVTTGGNTIDSFDNFVMAPAPFDSLTTLYAGASTSGEVVFTVPTADAATGTLAVTPSIFGDKVFVAVQ